MMAAADLLAIYHCNYCQEDIFDCRIKCCTCEDFDLCVECFSLGAEIGKHKNYHQYQIMDPLGFSIFGNNWTAREEILCLDTIEQYGYGNWQDIARHIGTKIPDEVHAHFKAKYVEGNLGQLTWKPRDARNLNIAKDHTHVDEGPLSPGNLNKLPPLEVTPQEASVLGYLPHRNDFEKEYNNDAEKLVSQLLENGGEDDDLDDALKLAHTDMYIRQIKERVRRKRIARDYQLAKKFFVHERIQIAKKKWARVDQKFQEKVKVFQQFNSSKEHEHFLSSMQKERELRVRVRELLRYRRSGLRNVGECAEYEHVRYKRDCKKRNRMGDCGNTLDSAQESVVREREDGSASPIERLGPVSFGLSHDADGGAGTEKAMDGPLPGYSLLSHREKQICHAAKLKPSQYISYKSIALKEHLEKLRRDYSRSFNPSSYSHLNVFFNKAGWLPVR